MSGDGSVMLFFGDQEYRFQFAIGAFAELQEKINTRRIAVGGPLLGPMGFLKLLQAKDAWPADIRDVLRIGLVGGGMKPADAHKLLALYFDRAPPLEHVITAYAVLFVGLFGVPYDEVGSKKKTEEPTSTTKDQSDSPSSMDRGLH